MPKFTNYVSIKSVLYDLMTISDERQWNETNLTEWAFTALRKNKSDRIFTNKLALRKVIDHKTVLPDDCKYVYQIAYRKCSNLDIENDLKKAIGIDNIYFENSNITHNWLYTTYGKNNIQWRPLRLNPSPFASALHCGYTIPLCPECEEDYTITEDMILTTSMKEGFILISYLAHPSNSEGDALIPDNQDLREAIMHYCLYRFFMSKVIMNMGVDQGAERQRDFHLGLFETLNAKAAGSMNLPGIDELENMKNRQKRLVNTTSAYDSLFINLGSKVTENNL